MYSLITLALFNFVYVRTSEAGVVALFFNMAPRISLSRAAEAAAAAAAAALARHKLPFSVNRAVIFPFPSCHARPTVTRAAVSYVSEKTV